MRIHNDITERSGNTGIAEVIKARKAEFKAIAVEPSKSPVIAVSEEDAGPISKEINQLDGIPVGISSGAAAWAAIQVAKRPAYRGKLIVAIMPSGCERCLSSWPFADIGIESDELGELIPARP